MTLLFTCDCRNWLKNFVHATQKTLSSFSDSFLSWSLVTAGLRSWLSVTACNSHSHFKKKTDSNPQLLQVAHTVCAAHFSSALDESAIQTQCKTNWGLTLISNCELKQKEKKFTEKFASVTCMTCAQPLVSPFRPLWFFDHLRAISTRALGTLCGDITSRTDDMWHKKKWNSTAISRFNCTTDQLFTWNWI